MIGYPWEIWRISKWNNSSRLKNMFEPGGKLKNRKGGCNYEIKMEMERNCEIIFSSEVQLKLKNLNIQ